MTLRNVTKQNIALIKTEYRPKVYFSIR